MLKVDDKIESIHRSDNIKWEKALENKNIFKPSGVIHITHKLSLMSHKMWNILFLFAHPTIEKNNEFTVPMSLMKRIFKTRNYKKITSELETLMATIVDLNILKTKDAHLEWDKSTLLSRAKLKEGNIHYKYEKDFKDLLIKSKIYARLSSSTLLKFKTKTGLILYELCKDYKGSTPYMDYDMLVKYFGIENPKSYKTISALNKRYIKPAVNEVNKISKDMLVTIEQFKKGRTIVEQRFNIHIIRHENQIDEDVSDALIIKRLSGDFKLSPQVIDSLLGKYSEKFIMAHIAYYEKQRKKKKIKKPSGFLLSAIYGNYAKHTD